jgi:glycine betaine transporter
MRYVFFHWGLHPWAVYGVVGLAIAFFQYRRQGAAADQHRHQRLAVALRCAAVAGCSTCSPWWPPPSASPPRWAWARLQINSGLQAVFGVAVDKTWQVATIIVVTTAIFVASAVSGVEKGVKLAVQLQYDAGGTAGPGVFLLGPTVAIIDTFSNTLGNYLPISCA